MASFPRPTVRELDIGITCIDRPQKYLCCCRFRAIKVADGDLKVENLPAHCGRSLHRSITARARTEREILYRAVGSVLLHGLGPLVIQDYSRRIHTLAVVIHSLE